MTDAAAPDNATSPPETTKAISKKKSNVNGSIDENEIRVTAHGKIRNYVAYAASLFSEEKSKTVVLKGMGRVINKTVSLAEILKRRVKGLYQCAEIGSIQVNDKKSSGKAEDDESDVVRLLSVIKIVLTTEPDDKARFQPPIDETQVLQEAQMVTSTPKRARANKSKAKKAKREAKAAADAEKSTDPPEKSEASPTKETDDQKGQKKDPKTEMPPKEGAVESSSDDKRSASAAKAKQAKRRKPKKPKKDAEKDTEVANGTPAEGTKDTTPSAVAEQEAPSKEPECA